jgi:hypothetical protein
MSNKSNHPRTNRKPCIDYMLVEEFIEQNNLTGKSCGYIEKLIHKYYNRHYSRISIGREIRQYCYNKGITMEQIQKNAITMTNITYKVGTHQTDEAKLKISKGLKGRHKSLEVRQHMIDAWNTRRMTYKDISEPTIVAILPHNKLALERKSTAIDDEIEFI